MLRILLLGLIAMIAVSCVTKKVNGKTVYIQDNPLEEGAELVIRQMTGADVDLSPGSKENHQIMGVEITHLFPERDQGDEVVKVEKKTTVTVEKKDHQE